MGNRQIQKIQRNRSKQADAQVKGSLGALAALRTDGSVVSWGNKDLWLQESNIEASIVTNTILVVRLIS